MLVESLFTSSSWTIKLIGRNVFIRINIVCGRRGIIKCSTNHWIRSKCNNTMSNLPVNICISITPCTCWHTTHHTPSARSLRICSVVDKVTQRRKQTAATLQLLLNQNNKLFLRSRHNRNLEMAVPVTLYSELLMSSDSDYALLCQHYQCQNESAN